MKEDRIDECGERFVESHRSPHLIVMYRFAGSGKKTERCKDFACFVSTQYTR